MIKRGTIPVYVAIALSMLPWIGVLALAWLFSPSGELAYRELWQSRPLPLPTAWCFDHPNHYFWVAVLLLVLNLLFVVTRMRAQHALILLIVGNSTTAWLLLLFYLLAMAAPWTSPGALPMQSAGALTDRRPPQLVTVQDRTPLPVIRCVSAPECRVLGVREIRERCSVRSVRRGA